MAATEQDSPWKELLDDHLREALAFFRPKVHADIDWSRDHESLEQELRKLLPESATGKRLADKLVKLFTLSGDERYLHVEAQGQGEPEFERRIYTYNYRARDRFKQPVASLVLLVDDDPDWRPRECVEEVWDTTVIFRFEPVKLLDWRGHEAELEKHANPVGLFVAACLEAMRTRKDDEERARAKLRLILRLHERKMEAEELRQWYRYFDWLLGLPKEHEDQVWEEIKRIEQEKKMPFVTYAERRGREIGRLLGMMELLLDQKFGAEGLSLLPALHQPEDADQLQAQLDKIKSATTLDEVRALISPAPTNGTPKPTA